VKLKLLTLLYCALLVSSHSYAQEKYWQQKVDYEIDVTLDDRQHMLRGHIQIHYFNNSPDTLQYIYFHLYPNAYVNDRTAYARQAVENGNTEHYFSDEEDRGYIDSLKFMSGKEPGDLQAAGMITTRDPDVVRLILPEPLVPGGDIYISTDFRVKIPRTFSRLGHTGQSYQISQWFPKPAVYDNEGWHPMPYLDKGEFYSEFGSYTVNITVPASYIVLATGNLMTAPEIAWLDSLSSIPLQDISPRTKAVDDTGTRTEGSKTLTFKEDNVHDFAWFADRRWCIRKDTVQLPQQNEPVLIYTAFFPEHKRGWESSVNTTRTAIRKYSEHVGPYPYKTVKVVEGAVGAAGGMEYPTITVLESTNDAGYVHTLIIHEVGHNWFYGILANNERAYPWLDEGINSFYEKKFTPRINYTKNNGFKGAEFASYAQMAADRRLLPADTAAHLYADHNYGVDIYVKTALYLEWLESYMGPAQFGQAMQAYYDTWKFKHPKPADFRAIFSKYSDKNIDWFFDEAMAKATPVDFSISKPHREGNQWQVHIRNASGLKTPVKYTLYGVDTAGNLLTHTAWTAPFTGGTTVAAEEVPGLGRWEKARIHSDIPDYNISNNNSSSPLSVGAFTGFNMEEKRKVWLAPALGYNYYDGVMAGLLLHNISVPLNRFQFMLAPLFGFGSKKAVGTGMISYTHNYDQGWLQSLQFILQGKTFSYEKSNLNRSNYLYNQFIKLAPEIVFNIRKPDWRSQVERSLSLKGYMIREHYFDFVHNPADSLFYPETGSYQDKVYGKIRYTHTNNRTFNPFSYFAELQAGSNFAKISAEANLKIDYHLRNKALYVRGFAGKFFDFGNNPYENYRYRLTSTFSGQNDYLYDDTYLGRNQRTGFYAQQISMREGGFKINTMQYANQLGWSDNFLVSLNLKSDLPIWNLPLRIFADVGTFSGAKLSNPSGSGILFDAGLELYLGNFISVYVPLLMSADFKDYTTQMYPNNRFWHTISFSINLAQINWTRLPYLRN